jgi:hypothetical protein
MSAMSKGTSSGTAAVWNDSNGGLGAMGYAADALGAAHGSSTDNYSGALIEGAAATPYGGGGGGRALVKSTTPVTAVATTYPSPQLRQSPFSGLYNDVEFPVHTFFSPPRPPGELLPRARRPNRNKAPVYVNDVARAGAREHNAQREVSRIWRGVLCRRRLRQARAMELTLSEKALKIQCWWRQLQAKWRRRQLSQIRSEWAKERTRQYIAERVLNTTAMIYWQRGKFERAALRIQRAVRWYLREKERRRCAEAGLPPSEWPPALMRPSVESHQPYFPWRHKQVPPQRATAARKTAAARVKSGPLVEATTAYDEAEYGEAGSGVIVVASPTRRTLLQFRDTPKEVLPPTQAEVEQINAKMRLAEAQRAAALQTPEAVSRKEWKTDGIRQEDLDFNAGILQRLYRSKRAPETVHTKELTAAYFNKAARIIARTFRMYVLIKRIRTRRVDTAKAVHDRTVQRSAAKIEQLKTEAVWQKDLMDAAATSIQRCWAWYRYRLRGIVPASYQAKGSVPTLPCYGLIQAHIEREHALRWTTMNLLEQRQYEEKRQHKYLRYVPKKVELYEHAGFLFVQAPPEPQAKAAAEL